MMNNNFYLKTGKYNKGMFDLVKVKLFAENIEYISFKDVCWTKDDFFKEWKDDDRLINYLKKLNNKIIIECISCKRTQIVMKNKLIKCDYYTCSLGCCKMNPEFELPEKHGCITVIEFNAAGSFSGIINRVSTKEEQESLNRAKKLKYLGELQVKEKGQNFKCN